MSANGHLSARDTDWEQFLTRFDADPAHVLAGQRLTAVLWFHMLLRANRSRCVIREQAERGLALLPFTKGAAE